MILTPSSKAMFSLHYTLATPSFSSRQQSTGTCVVTLIGVTMRSWSFAQGLVLISWYVYLTSPHPSVNMERTYRMGYCADVVVAQR